MERIKTYTVSLGCPKTRVDTESFLGGLGPGRFVPVDEPAGAELIFINTCGFIAPAVEESAQTIIEAAEAAREGGGGALVAAAGCLVARYGAGDLAVELPEVDLWLDLSERHRWPEMVLKALGRAGSGAAGRLLSTGPGYAYLKIAEGCPQRCAFCTIPDIRGPLRSRPPEEVLAEARSMLEQGAAELVLVAQDLTSYGRDLCSEPRLADLVESLAGLQGLDRLRLMYLYPAGLTDGFLSRLSQVGPPLAPYFDVPLQHAHADVLSAMGRPFARDPRKVVERIRARFPDAALRTSLITGYPGETEDAFRTLRDFVAETRFHHMGVFVFEPEDGTPAAELPGRVDRETAEARREELMSLQAGISEEILGELVGTAQGVVVDEPSPEWPGLHVGRCWFQAPEADGVTWVSGPGVHPGALVRARIDEAKTYDLVALAE